jgi:hypothetical protein
MLAWARVLELASDRADVALGGEAVLRAPQWRLRYRDLHTISGRERSEQPRPDVEHLAASRELRPGGANRQLAQADDPPQASRSEPARVGSSR